MKKYSNSIVFVENNFKLTGQINTQLKNQNFPNILTLGGLNAAKGYVQKIINKDEEAPDLIFIDLKMNSSIDEELSPERLLDLSGFEILDLIQKNITNFENTCIVIFTEMSIPQDIKIKMLESYAVIFKQCAEKSIIDKGRYSIGNDLPIITKESIEKLRKYIIEKLGDKLKATDSLF